MADSDSDEARALTPLEAAACTYRIAFGPRAGRKVLTLQGAMPREADFKQNLCADIQGFSLHAAVRCSADDRQALEQLCRTITRPVLADERVQCNAAGQGVLKLKTAWRDGTTHQGTPPLEFMQRLAALVPRPRLHLIRFHGVLAPSSTTSAKLRAMVVPQGPHEGAQATPPAECDANCAHHHPVRLSWARLLKRVFEIDMAHCPNCGGELKIIAAILEAPVIEKILTHLGLQARAPPRTPARGQALQAEPGHKQSSGLFVPGEGPGHWPGAPCKGPDHAERSPLKRPGARGTGAWLRLIFFATDPSGIRTRGDPQATPMTAVFRRSHRHSTGRSRTQASPQERRLPSLAGPRTRKKAFEFPILGDRARRH